MRTLLGESWDKMELEVFLLWAKGWLFKLLLEVLRRWTCRVFGRRLSSCGSVSSSLETFSFPLSKPRVPKIHLAFLSNFYIEDFFFLIFLDENGWQNPGFWVNMEEMYRESFINQIYSLFFCLACENFPGNPQRNNPKTQKPICSPFLNSDFIGHVSEAPRFSQCDRPELPMEVFFQRMCDSQLMRFARKKDGHENVCLCELSLFYFGLDTKSEAIFEIWQAIFPTLIS